MLKKIGITGGIGSGKTTVCKIFETLGVPIYYADLEAKKIISINPAVKRQIKELLGAESYYKNGKPNKTYIATKIFNNTDLLESMNKIVHPAVQTDVERWYENIKSKTNATYVLKEAALLVETKSYKHLDALIVVTCPENIRIKRVMERDQVSEEAVTARIKNQLPEDEKVRVSDHIIKNDGNTPLIPQVWEIHRKYSGHN
ncbi:MAG TPA: dephospho-CoA kinase [Saprospiraceae bacterium]|nr:dephospho-CoA kinase [Saprospiraceae bacterium]HMU06040.1 dephospho-CoA kinase [Saprospiraceae bacterium]